jgi:membrane fusion protein, multidrug efflux system
MLPNASIVHEGDNAYAWRVKDGKLQKVALGLGERDVRSGAYALTSGLGEGDQILRFPGSTLKDGQAVQSGGAAKPTVVAEK